jgi:hypothetical protein
MRLRGAHGLHPVRQRCRAVAMGPGAACVAFCPAPHGVVTGKKPEREGIRPDRRVPHVSGCGVWLVISRPTGCVGPKGIGGLRCSCRAAVQDGGGLADFYCCGYGPKWQGWFSNFLITFAPI